MARHVDTCHNLGYEIFHIFKLWSQETQSKRDKMLVDLTSTTFLLITNHTAAPGTRADIVLNVCILCSNSNKLASEYDILFCFVCVCMCQCEHYHKGLVSGSVCKSLCEEKTLTLQHCLSTSPTHQVNTLTPWQYKNTGLDKKSEVNIVVEQLAYLCRQYLI